jgi:hypothetical protein
MLLARRRVMATAVAVAAFVGACQLASPGGSVAPSANPTAAPSAAPSAEPSASAPGAAREPLVQVLDFLTLDATNVLFTDWEALKAAYGMADLTSADPLDERLAFLAATVPPSATDAPYACFACRGSRADVLKANWGFDNLDLAWEAEIWQQRARVAVLRFQDDADLAPLISRFDERGFSTELRDGVTIRVHALDRSDWMINVDPAMLNAAFLPDGHTLLLATTLAALESALSQDAPLPALRSAPVLRDAVAALERPSSAFLAFDLNDLCNPFLNLPPSHPELETTVQSLLERAGTLHPYTVMAVGNRGSLTPPGRIVFGYGDPTEAIADLAGRRLLTDEGVSVLQALGKPLREIFFTLVDAQVTGGTLILSVGAPTSPLPSGVTSLGTAFFLRRIFVPDAIFAACDLGA